MSTKTDPRRLPVYVDRKNNRLLAQPPEGGPWFVVSAGGGGGSSNPASLTTPGIVQLEDSVTSTSNTTAATPNSVRQAFALADLANTNASGASANATTALNNSNTALTTANSISGTATQAAADAAAAVTTANAAAASASSTATALNGKLNLTGGVITGELNIGPTGALAFEGSTANAFETYLTVVNPTADRTITLPNATGTVALLETANSWGGHQDFTTSINFASATCNGAFALGTGGSIVFEGSVNDAFKTTLNVVNPTASRSINLPNASGTVALLDALSTVAVSGNYVDLTNKPNLGTAAALDVASSGNAASGQVVKGNDGRLTTDISYSAVTRVVGSSTGGGATLPLVADGNAGLAPASGGGTGNFLRADGTWAVPPGAAATDGNKGDISVTIGGTDWRVNNGAISYTKLQNTSTGNRILGRSGSTGGPIDEIACTQAGRDMIAASDTSSQRTLLGLGSLATQNVLGNIGTTGAIGTLAGAPIITGTGGVLQAGIFGTSAGTFCVGNDARLSDARTTPNALTVRSDGTGVSPNSIFNGSSPVAISHNSIGAAALGHIHGNISNDGKLGTTSGLPLITTTGGTITTGLFGSSAGTFCVGNDARLSDARNTANSVTFNNTGFGDVSGTSFNGGTPRTISFNTVGAAASSHIHGAITNNGAIGATANLPIITGASGVLQAGSFGTSSATFCEGNDSRLSNSRTTPQALTFNSSGSGAAPGTTFNGSIGHAISYNSIGAAPTASPTFSGVVTAAAYLDTGSGVSTAESLARIGRARTSTGDAGVHLYTATGGAETARLRRYGGANSNLELLNAGAGDFYINLNGQTRFTMGASRMAFLNGGGTSVGITALWSGQLTGSANGTYHYVNGTIANDVTSSAAGFSSALVTANSATAYILPTLVHFDAAGGAKGTNTTINNEIGFRANSTLTNGAFTAGFLGDIASGTNRFNFYASGTAPNYFAGTIASLGSYTAVTANAANMWIDSAGNIRRSVSSIRYKRDIEDLESQYADNVILGARPVWFRSTCESDNPQWSHYGLIAEELAEIDPRFVFWGRPTKSVLQQEAKEAVLDENGKELEPAQEEQWTQVEDTDAPLQPEGVAYDRLTVMLIDVVQRQQQAIAELQEQVATLSA